jgi:SAM-dependent methyltransferase
MPESDSVFTDAMSGRYERLLGPLFAPFADHVADLVAAYGPSDVLETAAGTGILTRRLADVLPGARITATDLNAPMLAYGEQVAPRPNVHWQQADAQDLPFGDASFDLAVCQFGAMFFPDRRAAYRESRRVLQSGRVFILVVWGPLDRNDFTRVVDEATATHVPAGVQSFIRRVPFGYADMDLIKSDLSASGFDTMEIDTVSLTVRASATDLARGICEGTPLAADLGTSVEAAVSAATSALEEELGTSTPGEMEGISTALVVVAS